ncbi:hypothetical protein CEUSTIGMA_g618.t1 [Chlamydomonas eustigma]|uniref:Protein kinase domain-containing protein n=1 Tax=Chlamydomonas eustigma TaxID=1157962 RepID=A0A250WQP2_9CHLO|nr:hypothetical protein CEUSTIGMA_g618.t1 [Chlamydomonas eustigma]|eukprot:GAX73165.1 hypothetical protein CEUSTIGMA_g618.t1 [Chlamydomonas eustigma]
MPRPSRASTYSSRLAQRVPAPMVLELCKGGSIAKKVYKQMTEYSKIYTDLEALGWMTDIAQGLDYLHSLSPPVALHRDVKLENIILLWQVPIPKEEGGGVQVVAKLADFGLHMPLDDTKMPRMLRALSVGFSKTSKPVGGEAVGEAILSNCSAAPVPRLYVNPGGSIVEPQAETNSSPQASHGADTALAQEHVRSPEVDPKKLSPLGGLQLDKMCQPRLKCCEEVLRLDSEGQVDSSLITGSSMLYCNPVSADSPLSFWELEAHNSLFLNPHPHTTGVDAMDESSAGRGNRSQMPPLTLDDMRHAVKDECKKADSAPVDVKSKSLGVHRSSLHPPQVLSGNVDGNNFTAGDCIGTLHQGRKNMLMSLNRPSAVSAIIKHAVSTRYEVAFQMTGETGSAMSPEVFRHQPNNEKADVYSFGVMLYEVFARNMLVTTPAGNDPDGYAARVAEGHRPEKPIKMDPDLFALIKWCWRQDPNERPGMKDVIQCLRVLKASLLDTNETSSGNSLGTTWGVGALSSDEPPGCGANCLIA